VTVAEIMAMAPGRELDALIAREIFGLTLKRITVVARETYSDWGTVDPPRQISDGREGVAAHAIPAYSTEIAPAWDVVRAHRARPVGGYIAIYGQANEWAVEIPCSERLRAMVYAPPRLREGDLLRCGGMLFVYAQREQLAICRAALLAGLGA
jgi:hypothetical protein